MQHDESGQWMQRCPKISARTLAPTGEGTIRKM
jgi:hypothetical protein